MDKQNFLTLGKTYLIDKKYELAIFNFLEYYNTNPTDPECLYELTKYYRETGQHNVSHMFYTLNKNNTNTRFTDLLDYEYSINSFYLDNKIDKNKDTIVEFCMKLINKNTSMTNSIYNNLRFYIKPINKSKTVILTKNIGSHTTSSSCIFLWPSNKSINSLIPKYGLNIRLVNYTIDKKTRRYSFKLSNKILTRNLFIGLDQNLNSIYETEIITNMDDSLDYLGVEDLKVLPVSNNLYYIGSVQYKDSNNNKKITLNHGIYDLEAKTTTNDNNNTIVSPKDRICEKNWAMFYNNEKINIIYEWYPLQIGNITDNQLIINKNINTPKIFSYLKGSSNGFLYNDNFWFLTHCSINNGPRLYYHCIVLLNKDTYEIVNYSKLFQFEGEPIEYTLGFVIDNNKFIVSYSLWDNECKLAEYDLKYIESLLTL